MEELAVTSLVYGDSKSYPSKLCFTVKIATKDEKIEGSRQTGGFAGGVCPFACETFASHSRQNP